MTDRLNLKKVISQAKVKLDPSIISSFFPFTRKTGIVFFLHKEQFCGKLDFSQHHIGNPITNVLHGGIVAALLQNTAQFHIVWEKNIESIPEIIDISINFLRIGKGVDTYARASIIKYGKRVANVEVIAWNDDKFSPIANASINFLV
ncbi:MAG: thioesterase [Rhodospirillaceae bacterium]|nr:thioesterase [Rhodospirillaceae bacterium]|tara:strand:- start:244 stop:684 length:441 start_codon:yes stop_codon:yes gene_type:complete